MNLFKKFQWRYAVKKYDPTKKVDQNLVDQIIEAARIAPTSSGLQPLQVIEIKNEKAKKDILQIANNQQQIVDCSHLLVFAAWDNYTEARIDHIFDYTTKERGQAPDTYKQYTDMLKKKYLNRPAEINLAHATFQTYLAFGFAIAMAAELKVDSTPIEGFDNKALDTYLNLDKYGLRSATILCLGYRDEANDWLVHLKKVRHPKSEFLIEIN